MKIKSLIEILNKLPKDNEVIVFTGNGVREISSVEPMAYSCILHAEKTPFEYNEMKAADVEELTKG